MTTSTSLTTSKTSFKKTFRFDYDYEFDHEYYDFLETFRLDYEYEFDYEHDFLAFELVLLTTRSSAILVIIGGRLRDLTYNDFGNFC